jgi:large repetitive protein
VVATDGAGNSRQLPITINRDASSPSLTISSPVSGQMVTSSTITVSGSATDSGSGGNGITSVSVNGQTASGGTASGNNTAFWSRSVSVSSGTNTISVVATDGAGSTRTMSITVTRTSLSSGLSAVAVTPNSGSGTTQTFTAQFGDTSGSADVSMVYVRFSAAPTGSTNTCMVRYDRAARRLSLRDDAGNWQTGVSPGSSVTQQNSQCSLSLAGSAASSGGQLVTVTVAVTFKNAYSGLKNIYLYAQSVGGVITNWQQRGTWTVPAVGLSVGAVTPNAGSGAAQLFSAQYLDSLGASDLAYVYLKFAAQASGATNTCMVRYDRAAATLSLRDDAGVWQPPQPFSLGGAQQNSQCAVNFSGSSATVSGQTLTLNVAMSFKPGYAGAKNIYGFAQTNIGAVTDWQQAGTWTILAGTLLSADAVTPNSGSGSFGTFSAQYTDQFGISDLAFVYLKFDTDSTGAAATCMIRYEHATGRLALRDDAGTWMTGRTFAQGGTQQNSQCEISISGSSASVDGHTLTLTVPFTFTPAYSGAKNIYSYASNVVGAFTDWQPRGTWTIP